GYAYAAYGHLKLSAVVEDLAHHLYRLGGRGERPRRERIRQALWSAVRKRGINADDAMTAAGAKPDVVDFFRTFDVNYRTRRLRFLARRLVELDEQSGAPREVAEPARQAIYDLINRYRTAVEAEQLEPQTEQRLKDVEEDPEAALVALADLFGLKAIDEEADERLTELLGLFPKLERRALILTYLGFPFYDIATLPLLQGEGLDEFDPIKVDRISPDDATAIREGGAAATLKGIQFNSFGAFFSRAYRENDYLWGRLHGADRLIDIVVSTLPEGKHLPAGAVAGLKRDAFRAILAEERPRLALIQPLFDELEKEVG
ncbi:MAG TPA: DUF3376 domain-containing protein, partial [Allosphingosinicella sp.]|nr:DUF3376 domain-containing protein [Allosphingosinicella sp.]